MNSHLHCRVMVHYLMSLLPELAGQGTAVWLYVPNIVASSLLEPTTSTMAR